MPAVRTGVANHPIRAHGPCGASVCRRSEKLAESVSLLGGRGGIVLPWLAHLRRNATASFNKKLDIIVIIQRDAGTGGKVAHAVAGALQALLAAFLEAQARITGEHSCITRRIAR